MNTQKVRIAVFVSGRGTNLQAMLEFGQAHPEWPVEIVLVVSDKLECPGLAVAQSSGIPTIAIRPRISRINGRLR